MDSFTAGTLLNTIDSDNINEVATLYKELSSGGGNPPTEYQIKWFNDNKGKFVKVAKHIGIVDSLNTSAYGFYEGGRYPIYVKIVSTDSVHHSAIERFFEYGVDQLEVIEEKLMKKHSFNQTEVFMTSRRVGQTHKDFKWNEFTKAVKEFGGSVRVTGGTYLTHEVLGLNEADFNFILDYIR